jgi:membrane-bound ClpP family serine protease
MKRLGYLLSALVISCLCLLNHLARAMEFSIVNGPATLVLQADGEIVDGDAIRLKRALTNLPRDNSGMKTITLNSPGGSVNAAFEMAAVMDTVGVGTVVPPGASCASACAAILFMAGKVHLVAPGGKLGIHTCYNGNTMKRDDLCNERMAQFALEHGNDHGSVYLYTQLAGPDGMIWFDAYNADCWGETKHEDDKQPPFYKKCLFDMIRNVSCKHGQKSACPK